MQLYCFDKFANDEDGYSPKHTHCADCRKEICINCYWCHDCNQKVIAEVEKSIAMGEYRTQ